MKRIFALFLSVCLILCLSACGKVPAEDTTPTETAAATTAATTVPPETTVSTADTEYIPDFTAISMPLVREETYAQDGTLLFTYTYQNVFPMLLNPEAAEAVSLDLLNRIDTSRSLAESVKSMAQTDYPNAGSGWTPYYCSVYYNTMRFDSYILSLFGDQVSYQGGTHPSRQCVSTTYDLRTGKALGFSDILGSTENLSRLIIDALAPQASSLYGDYETIITNRFAGEDAWTENWYLSDMGLCIFFSPYDIAPYASGTIVAEIPYESLAGVFTQEYFPPARSDFQGTLGVTFLKEADLSRFNQFAEVILDQSGDQYLLYPDSRVYDIRIEKGSYYGSYFVPDATVFAAETIAPGEGIMVQTATDDNSINLRVSYHNGSETVSFFLLQGGGAG